MKGVRMGAVVRVLEWPTQCFEWHLLLDAHDWRVFGSQIRIHIC